MERDIRHRPRQSGKTTLCKMAFPDYEYVNLERATTRELIRQDIEGYLLNHPDGLIIDEAQNLPELFSVLQVVVDEHIGDFLYGLYPSAILPQHRETTYQNA